MEVIHVAAQQEGKIGTEPCPLIVLLPLVAFLCGYAYRQR